MTEKEKRTLGLLYDNNYDPSWLQNYPPAKTFVMPATRFRLPT